MDTVIQILSWLFLLAGSFFGLTGALGLFRFPDFYTRLHSAGVTDTMATLFIVLGLVLQSNSVLVGVKLGFILLFVMITSPTASHALAKAALHSGLKPYQR